MKIALFSALLLAQTAIPAFAGPFDNLSETDRASLQAEIKNYIVNNPEILVEAFDVLEARQANAAAETESKMLQEYNAAIFYDGYSFIGGNPDGDVTLVEFLDYKCGYCKKAFSDVSELLKKDGNIRFVIKEFPILGEESLMASQAAIATLQLKGPEAYEAFHDALMEFKGRIDETSLSALAKQSGFDYADIQEHMKGKEVEDIIAKNHELAKNLQISGTPTFILPKQFVRGYAPLNALEQIVAAERQ